MTRAKIEVVAAVIERQGGVLLAKRPESGRHGGRWEFPGGKVQDGEDRSEAMARELREELGVEVTRVEGALHTLRDPGTPFAIHFLSVEIGGEPEPLEHEELRWCQMADLEELPLAPADRQFALEFLLPRVAR